MALETLVDRMSTSPARIAQYADHGHITPGMKANLTLVDLEAEWKVERALLHSKSRNTPFHNMVLPGLVMKTFHNGALVFDRKVS